jgi:DNA-binding transcriptional ArsR family regulator
MATKTDTRDTHDYEHDAALLAVLASPVRLQVIALLHGCPADDPGLALIDLTELVNQRRKYPLANSTMGAHLRRMADIGLVTMDRSRHPWTFYRLDLAAVGGAAVLDSCWVS